MPAAALFDLDGTLMDTAPDIHAAAAAMLRELKLPPLAFDEARGYIGDGVSRFVKRALTRQWWGEPDAELLRRAELLMFKHYAKECTARMICYDGVVDTLRLLQRRGVLMACVTNKPAMFSAPLLRAAGLSRFFAAIISGDTLPVKKPDPAPLLAATKTIGADIRQTWMIGDSAADAKAAKAAGCRFAVVRYGYHRNGELPPAACILAKFADVAGLLLPSSSSSAAAESSAAARV